MSVRNDHNVWKDEALAITHRLQDVFKKELQIALEKGLTVEDFTYMVMSQCEYVTLRHVVESQMSTLKTIKEKE